jgi:hypothetical protein
MRWPFNHPFTRETEQIRLKMETRKMSVRWICVVLALCAAMAVSAVELKLSISSSEPLLLSWSTNIPSFALESKPDLDPSASFVIYPAKPGIVGTNFVLTNLFTGSSRMYRLSNWPQKMCINQMKQIGLSFAVWALDYNDSYPFAISTNLGGTREFRAIGPDGFDTNSRRHFMVLSNELSFANLLVCRGDVWRTAITNFPDLQPENVTYRLRTDDSVRNGYPGIVLSDCPIDGNTLYCDGAVVQGTNYLK